MATVDTLIPTWEPSWNPQPNSDGWKLHAIDLALIGGYAESLEDMPTDEEMDRMIARAREIAAVRGRVVNDE